MKYFRREERRGFISLGKEMLMSAKMMTLKNGLLAFSTPFKKKEEEVTKK